jgi:hypothetical protein
VFVDDAASDGRRIFDRHVPAIELDHLRAHLAMDGVERGLANNQWSRWGDGHEEPRSTGLSCQESGTDYVNTCAGAEQQGKSKGRSQIEEVKSSKP